ncbi:MAG: phosphotransferase family protein [Candidatus Thorarchaeota archaeon]
MEKYLRGRLLDRENVTVAHLNEITDGWETEIYSFDAESSKDGEKSAEKLVLRLYSGPWAAHKARKEFGLLKRLREAGYPVPRVSLMEVDSVHLGQPFIVMQRIEGSAMWVLLESETDTSDHFQLFCKLFFNLHELDWHLLVENADEFKGLDSMKSVMRWIEKYESRAKELGRKELLDIVEWLNSETDSVSFEKLSAVHNDFHPNNILVDNSGHPFVIDWTAADVTDYRVDLAWTLVLTKIYVGDSMRDTILRGYEDASQKKAEDIHFFEVLGALRRLTDILVSLDVDSEEIGLREGAAEVIREQLAQNMTLLDIVKNHTGLDLPEIRELMAGAKT